jgi:YD repeat-containing protein
MPVRDAGVGDSVVTPFGAVERGIRLPVVEDGMQGLARLYHQWLKVDASYTAWDGSGDSLEGGDLPFASVAASNLDNTVSIDSVAVDPSLLVQPRPGTMPGIYLYYDDETGKYYQYGGPVDSGASPQTTAVYSYASTIEGGGGMFKPSFLGPYATLIYSNNLSGAQLWYYGSASTPYIEIKHVDGSVARFDSFNPYRSSYTPTGTLWHVTSVIDPYDNTATYSYDAAHRLKQIRFPSTYLQKFNYAPSWSGWGSGADLLEITYEKENPGHANITLPARTWGLAFQGTLGTSGGGHFGKRLYRTYSAVRRVLHDPPSGAAYTWASTPYEDGQIVCDLTYDTTARTLTEEQSVHTGTAFAATLSGSGFSTVEVLETSFYGSGSSDAGRVLAQVDSLTLETFVCTYTTSDVRTSDLVSGATDIRAIEVLDLGGTVRRYEYDYEHGHIYRVVTTPNSGALGRPRADAVSGDNAGIGGVAASDIEPDKITVDNVYDGSCVCQQPIEVRRISTRGSSTTTRTTNYEYLGGTKLLKKRSEPNPVTGSGQVSWEYTYVQAKGSGHAWGAWLPETETTPDGIFHYEYDSGSMQARADSASHGQMPGKIVRVAEDVRLVTTLTGSVTASGFGTDVTTTTYLNLSSNPSGIGWSGANIQGQPRKVVDPDGVASAFDYSPEGWMTRSYSHNLTVYSEYAHNDYGEVTAATDSASSSPLAATTAFTLMSGIGVPSDQATTGATNGLLAKSEQYFDRFGHLGIERRWNRSSTGSKPTNHNGSTTNARDWVEDQYHYLHNRLVVTYRDRLPLDLPAGTGQFLKTELVWDTTHARLDYVVNPNGSRTYYEFDGYGTQYRSYTKDPTLTYTVTGPKQFVSPFLEVTGSYQFAGGSDHLWTLIERNDAGTIASITEPETVAPSDYTSPSGGGLFSTGGARHEFTVDALGRVTLAETYEDTGTAALLLAYRQTKYDQLGRQIWQHDDARLRAIGGSTTSTTGDSYAAWKYRAGSADQLDSVERSGIAATSYSYLSSGLMDLVTDGFGNETEYTYVSGTTFLSQVERTDDPAGTPRVTRTAFGVDELGRHTTVSEGVSSPLVSTYGFSMLGNVDHVTDPMGREQKFLHDATGRIVEHVREGASSDIILNTSEYADSGASDGRTKITRKDDLLHKTVTHFDFAGRPFTVQNPGADFSSEPGPTAKNKSMCLYAEYDEASRIKYTYAGDEGRTEYWRDGMGRVIQQQLEPLPGETEWAFAYAPWNTRDVFRRDALGRIPQVDYWGLGDYSLLWAVGTTERDSVNRVHKEDYYFFHAPGNHLSLISGYPPSGSGSGTPFRTSLDYVDNLGSGLTQPLSLDLTHDSIGRLTEIDWDKAVGGSGSNLLVEYDWVGALRRSRTVNYNASPSSAVRRVVRLESHDLRRLVGTTRRPPRCLSGSRVASATRCRGAREGRPALRWA